MEIWFLAIVLGEFALQVESSISGSILSDAQIRMSHYIFFGLLLGDVNVKLRGMADTHSNTTTTTTTTTTPPPPAAAAAAVYSTTVLLLLLLLLLLILLQYYF